MNKKKDEEKKQDKKKEEKEDDENKKEVWDEEGGGETEEKKDHKKKGKETCFKFFFTRYPSPWLFRFRPLDFVSVPPLVEKQAGLIQLLRTANSSVVPDIRW